MADSTHDTDSGQVRCPHAWHGGLPFGMLIDCKYEQGHRGVHRNSAHAMSWTGKLTADEQAKAKRIRETGAVMAS